MDLSLFIKYGPSLLQGFGVTVMCWLLGSLIGLAAGFLLAILYRNVRALRLLLRVVIEAIRGTPFLVQLFLLYGAGPSIGIRLNAPTAGVVALGIYSAAYLAEIFRGGFDAAPQGQIEAALSLGMKRSTVLRRITMPSVIAVITPAIVNMLIVLSKETVVLSVITVPELMYATQTMAGDTFATLQSFIALALFYWLFIETIARGGKWVERRFSRHQPEKRT